MPENRTPGKLKALSMLVGYIIGVGMFGLPYVTAKSGIVVFVIMLMILGSVQYILHLIYADIIIQTETRHRMAGYAGIYLGKYGKIAAFIAKMIGNLGALLAYIIIIGIFAHQLFSPFFGGSEFLYGNIFFAVLAFIVLFGLGVICEFELMMTGLLVLIIFLIMVKGAGFIRLENYSAADWKHLFLPYGAMLFAIDGIGSIPIVARLLRYDKDDAKKVIRWGTFISIAIIFLFTVVVVGVTGQATTPDSLAGLNNSLGNGVVAISLTLGLLVIATSFIGVAVAVKETLMFDFRVSGYKSWIIALFVPYFLYLIGINNLTEVISFAGAAMGGISAIILIMIFRKMESIKQKMLFFKKKPSLLFLILLSCLFVLGMAYEVWAFLL